MCSLLRKPAPWPWSTTSWGSMLRPPGRGECRSSYPHPYATQSSGSAHLSVARCFLPRGEGSTLRIHRDFVITKFTAFTSESDGQNSHSHATKRKWAVIRGEEPYCKKSEFEILLLFPSVLSLQHVRLHWLLIMNVESACQPFLGL
jgi:hypothetical protein